MWLCVSCTILAEITIGFQQSVYYFSESIGQANLKLLVIGVLDADNVILSVNTLSNGSATGKHL